MPKAEAYIFKWGHIENEITETSMTSVSAPTVTNILKSEEISSEGVVTSG